MTRRVFIIALPVDDDALDVLDVQAPIVEAFPTGGDDSLDCAVYVSVDALLDDLGVDMKARPWQ